MPRFSDRQRARNRIGVARLNSTEMATLDEDGVALAAVRALAIPCPRCKRPVGKACTLPEGLERQGLLIHHERFAAVESTDRDRRAAQWNHGTTL